MSEGEPRGRGHPPKSGQFPPGVSGNPKGRPPGSKRLAPYEMVLGRTVTLKEGGVSRKMSARDAFLHALTKRGLEGDVVASRLAAELLSADRARAEALSGASTRVVTITFLGARASAVLVLLNLAVKHDAFRDTARYRLQPWIVEAALARFGPRRLSIPEQKIVWDAARTPRKVRWPDWWEYRSE